MEQDLLNKALFILKKYHKLAIWFYKERIRIKIKQEEPFSGMILENIKNGTLD